MTEQSIRDRFPVGMRVRVLFDGKKRFGTVIGYSHSTSGVRVRKDGTNTATLYHHTYLMKEKE